MMDYPDGWWSVVIIFGQVYDELISLDLTVVLLFFQRNEATREDATS